MKKEQVITEAGRKYAEAYKKHFSSKDLYGALQSYKEVVTSYPNSQEAEYSRTQIQNIMQDVVPKDVLYAAHLEMALKYVKKTAGAPT
jgi:hypothetical protein